MSRAIPVVHPAIEFRCQQKNYLRHITSVSMAKATIDTSHPPPCPRLVVYQRRMTRDRAIRQQIENEYLRAIKAAALERARARAPRTGVRRERKPRDWQSELPKVSEELNVKPPPPRTAASKKREESIFEQDVYQDDGMIVVDERRVHPPAEGRAKSQRVTKVATCGRTVQRRRPVLVTEVGPRRKSEAPGELREDRVENEKESFDKSKTFGSDFEEFDKNDHSKNSDGKDEKAQDSNDKLEKTFGGDFEKEEDGKDEKDEDGKDKLERTFGSDFENDEDGKDKLEKTFGSDFENDEDGKEKLDKTFGSDFEKEETKQLNSDDEARSTHSDTEKESIEKSEKDEEKKTSSDDHAKSDEEHESGNKEEQKEMNSDDSFKSFDSHGKSNAPDEKNRTFGDDFLSHSDNERENNDEMIGSEKASASSDEEYAGSED